MNKKSKKTSLSQRIALIFFGLFLALATLEIGLRLGGFIIISLQEKRNLEAMKQRGACRIMCLGESTTQGEYPPYLEKALNQRNPGIKFSVIDKGVAGNNTKTIVSRLEADLDKYHPDIVVTMMGINDHRGGHIPYETDSNSKIIAFIKSLKTYKLFRMVDLHFRVKLKEGKLAVKSAPKETFSSAYGIEGIIGKERSLKKAIELNPRDDLAYAKLGWLYIDQFQYPEAEQAFKKAIELNPKNDFAYVGLGGIYFYRAQYPEAERAFKKAIELNPKNDFAYVGLGRVYLIQKKSFESERALKTAIELNPRNEWAYVGLGQLYSGQKGLPPETEQIFKKGIKFNPANDRVYAALARVYSAMGNNELSEIYLDKVNSLRWQYYSPITVESYHKLKQILDKRGVKLVCVQYPMRSIALLKRIFNEGEDVVFVDNEEIFKNAVAKEGYKEYFRDMFGGDFGHCTPKGNRLLAENIADNILNGLFGSVR